MTKDDAGRSRNLDRELAVMVLSVVGLAGVGWSTKRTTGSTIKAIASAVVVAVVVPLALASAKQAQDTLWRRREGIR